MKQIAKQQRQSFELLCQKAGIINREMDSKCEKLEQIAADVKADVAYGVQTRRRVRRLRRERMGRVMRRMLVVVGLYVGALLVVVLVVGGLYELLME